MKHKKVKLPQDNLPHDSIIEWWYFNGHLKDKQGHNYAFMNCLFKADIRKVNIPFLNKLPFKKNYSSWPYVYFAHAIISDISQQKSHQDIQLMSWVSGDSFTKDLLFINYTDLLSAYNYINNEITEITPGNFHLKNKNIDLQLKARKKPLLEGGSGFVTISQHQTYYYSLTDLDTKGSILINGKWLKVTGKSWLDHQWADVPYQKNKWSWFSLQLDNKTEIVCVEYSDGKNNDYFADVIDKNGKSSHHRQIKLTPQNNIWTSSKTKAEYPLIWNLEIPEKKIKLSIKSIAPEQEIIFGSINYFEGPTKISGTINKKKVQGLGFMELVGYPSDYNYLLLIGRGINKKIRNRIAVKLNKIKQKIK